MKHQPADTLAHPRTNGEVKTTLDYVVAVLTVSKPFLGCAPKTEITDVELTGEGKSPFFLFVPAFFIMAGIKDSKN